MRKRRDDEPFRTRADMLLEAALDDCDPDRLVPSGHDRAWVRKKHADIVREVVVGADVMSPAWAVELERRGLLADLTFVTLATADVETRRQALAILQIAESHAVRKAAIEELVRQVAGRVTGGGGLKAPFPWFGGKSRAAGLVWPRLGPVPNYVEPFAGSLAVLLARESIPNLETVNDLDGNIANFWRALAHEPDSVAHFADWPVNEIDLHARHRWLVETGRERALRLRSDPEYFDAKVAGWWVWGISQWIGSGWCSGPREAAQAKRPSLGHAGRGTHRLKMQTPRLSGRATLEAGSIPNPYGARGIEAGDQPLASWFSALASRLRRVRVCCGDWKRVVTPSATWKIGGGMVTGVFLDPPYSHDDRDARLYAEDHADVAAECRAWALEHGDNPLLRIALCGYEGEHDMPPTWERIAWKAGGGYGSAGDGRGRDNAIRERIWFSPACLRPQRGLFD